MTEEAKKPKRSEYVPKWAPHIQGWYEQRETDEVTGEVYEAPVGAECTICGQKFRRMCLSGLFRQHIANFALVHAHKDPFAGEKKP